MTEDGGRLYIDENGNIYNIIEEASTEGSTTAGQSAGIVKDTGAVVADTSSKVTVDDLDDEEESGTPVVGIMIALFMVVLPIMACIVMRIIAVKYPNSECGKKLNACRSKDSNTPDSMEVRTMQA